MPTFQWEAISRAVTAANFENDAQKAKEHQAGRLTEAGL